MSYFLLSSIFLCTFPFESSTSTKTVLKPQEISVCNIQTTVSSPFSIQSNWQIFSQFCNWLKGSNKALLLMGVSYVAVCVQSVRLWDYWLGEHARLGWERLWGWTGNEAVKHSRERKWKKKKLQTEKYQQAEEIIERKVKMKGGNDGEEDAGAKPGVHRACVHIARTLPASHEPSVSPRSRRALHF